MSALGAKSCQNQSKPAENTVNFPKKRAPKAPAKKTTKSVRFWSKILQNRIFKISEGGWGGGGSPQTKKILSLVPSFEKILVHYALTVYLDSFSNHKNTKADYCSGGCDWRWTLQLRWYL